jgi:hypothetical protein
MFAIKLTVSVSVLEQVPLAALNARVMPPLVTQFVPRFKTPAKGATVATLLTDPVAAPATVALTVYAITAPLRIATVVLILPVPDAAPHAVTTSPPVPGTDTAQVHDPKVTLTGAVSTNGVLYMAEGPLFAILMVYVVAAPAFTEGAPLVLPTNKSV